MCPIAFILNFGPSNASGSSNNVDLSSYNLGLLSVAIASLLSGLSTALTQKALTTSKPRSPIFMSAELAFFGIIILFLNLLFVHNDIPKSETGGYNLLINWNLSTLIPVISNALGGIVVGQVTKVAGGVVKGFALIAGLLITGFTSYLIDHKPLGSKDL
jgi:solute carrier family 35 (UDP-sugar transporter), member A1/2/3